MTIYLLSTNTKKTSNPSLNIIRQKKKSIFNKHYHGQPLTTISSIQCIFTITKYHTPLAKLMYTDMTDLMCPWHRPIDSPPLAFIFIILSLDEWVRSRDVASII